MVLWHLLSLAEVNEEREAFNGLQDDLLNNGSSQLINQWGIFSPQ